MCRSTRNRTYSVRTLANIDSYSDKSFSELHAMQSGDIWVGYAKLEASYAGKH